MVVTFRLFNFKRINAIPSKNFSVEVPKTKEENRLLKEGFVDDNNEHLAYFNFRIIWPLLALTISVYLFFITGVLGSLFTDDLPNPLELRRAFWTRYGSLRFKCNSTVPFPKHGLPSVLNLFEMNVTGNLMFRICSCLPVAVRLFVVYCRRELIRVDFLSSSFIHNLMNEVVFALSAVEFFAMALFSIVTIRKDSAEINRYCKFSFAIAASANMLITTAVIVAHRKHNTKRLDLISMMIKLLSTMAFCYVSPQYFQRHQANISFQMCHSYLPRVYAIMEYVMIASYGAFHLSSLIDIRHISFLCYPRTCSGECEPLDPKNFEKGSKFEYCRAFEYQQRRRAMKHETVERF
ncbi:hypothetical protein GCK32_011683 [Trichostrongylus colubriformis]|uniref:Uncharacterized protein n=1 Tax=Trichostrongylus colubriformis TaxID=6319 RepID=A0AAN8ITD4_TRICO